jgi:hypothetical protein
MVYIYFVIILMDTPTAQQNTDTQVDVRITAVPKMGRAKTMGVRITDKKTIF